MTYTCPICSADPTSHSLRKLSETEDIVCYYTCPAKASKYNDREGILAHYDGELAQKGDKKWIWIFDSEGFDMKHALEAQLAIEMAMLISSKYGESLEKICVINPTLFTSITVNVIWPFIGPRLRSIILFDSAHHFEIS
jgi:hypothetical protein